MGKALHDKLLPEQVVKKMKMFNDNKTSLTLTRDQVNQNPTKHIEMRDAPLCTIL